METGVSALARPFDVFGVPIRFTKRCERREFSVAQAREGGDGVVDRAHVDNLAWFPSPSAGSPAQVTKSGSRAFVDGTFQGTGDAALNAEAGNTFNGGHRMGYLTALQRSSRAAEGIPRHVPIERSRWSSTARRASGSRNRPRRGVTT